jgi:hypothetical protein
MTAAVTYGRTPATSPYTDTAAAAAISNQGSIFEY